MNINIPDKEKISKRRITIYIVSIIICVIALVVVACIIVLGNDFTDGLFGISSIKNKTEQEQRELIDNFDNLFNNGIEISNSELQVTKIDENQDIVYNQYSKQEKSDGNYDLDLNIPYINIDNEIIKGYNQEINDIFVQKAESVYQTEGENIIFKVEYEAFIENNILSLIIRSNLKQGSNPQQDIVQTYNFDLINNKEITLIDEISLLGLDESEVQKRIDNIGGKTSGDLEDVSLRIDKLLAELDSLIESEQTDFQQQEETSNERNNEIAFLDGLNKCNNSEELKLYVDSIINS